MIEKKITFFINNNKISYDLEDPKSIIDLPNGVYLGFSYYKLTYGKYFYNPVLRYFAYFLVINRNKEYGFYYDIIPFIEPLFYEKIIENRNYIPIIAGKFRELLSKIEINPKLRLSLFLYKISQDLDISDKLLLLVLGQNTQLTSRVLFNNFKPDYDYNDYLKFEELLLQLKENNK